MRLLLALMLVGCESAPPRYEVARVARVAIRGAAHESGWAENDRRTRQLAQRYLNAAAVLTWGRIPISDGFLDDGIGRALEGALPPNTTDQYRIDLLDAAQASLKP